MRKIHILIFVVLAAFSTAAWGGTIDRIISITPSNSEILFALGLKEKIIAVTDHCNYPKEALLKTKIGGVKLLYEKIVRLKPDLIIGLYDAQKRDIDQLRKYGLNVLSVNPHTIKELEEAILIIGKATDRVEQAQKINKNIEATIDKYIKEKSKNSPLVFVLINEKPLLTAGKKTFINDLINIAGANNLGAELTGSYPAISVEKLISANPDYIIIPSFENEQYQGFLKDSRLKNIKAIKNKKILFINADIISRPGPRIVKVLEQIYKYIWEK